MAGGGRPNIPGLEQRLSLSPQEQRIVDYHRNSIKTGRVGTGPNGEPVTVYSTGIRIPEGPNAGKFVSVPGFVNGRILSERELYDHWKGEIQSGQWPMYDSGEELNRRSQEIHTIMDAEADPARAARGGPQMPPRQPGMAPGAHQGNPLLANVPPQMQSLLAMMGPEKGAPMLMDAFNRKPEQRRIVQGADGYNYYEDTKERVIPGAEKAPDKPPTGYRVGADGNLEADPGWLATQLQLRQAGRSSVNVNTKDGGVNLTPGQEAVDKKYAPDYAEFVLGGGFADAEKGVEQLKGVVADLESGAPLTGTLAARVLPENVRAVVDPASLDAQQLVEEVVQRNLRLVLGAQFTQQEGERLIARAYNPSLSPENNATRLRRLFAAMEKGLQARTEAAQYYEEHGTLQGYKGTRLVGPADLDRALDGKDTKGEAPEPVKTMIYNPATGEFEEDK
jgi:hypothetical protein